MGRPKKGHHGKGHGKKGHHGAHEPLPNLALAAIDAVKLLDEQDEREHHWLGPAAAPRDPTKVVAQPARPLRNKTQVTYRQLIKSMTDAVKGARAAARKPDAPPPQVENYRVLESGEYTCAPRPEEPEEPAEQPEAPPKEDALLRGTRAIRRASPRKSNARKTNALGGVAAAMAMASAGVLRITSTMADVHKATADFVRRHSRAPGGEHLASAFRPDAASRAPPPPAVEEDAAPDASREEATSLARAAAFQNTFNGLKKHLVGKLAQGGHAVDIKALAMGALLDVFVHKAKEECMCDLLTIFLHDADKDELIARWATAFPSDFSHDAKAYVRIPQTAGLVGRSFNEGLVNIPDAYLEPGFNQAIDKTSGYRTKSVIACPIVGHATIQDRKRATIQDITHTAQGEGPHRLGAFQLINRLDLDEADKGEGGEGDDEGDEGGEGNEDEAIATETIEVKCLESPSGTRTLKVKAFSDVDRGKAYQADTYAVLGLKSEDEVVRRERLQSSIVV
ncbi:3',5'-cyclic-nucleotide phosphodiesterase [Aureococcus anophagefferens]|nr:3',5'-cyclic-nucleotide phosphodiesterase [Aureococcus anophagefferens]